MGVLFDGAAVSRSESKVNSQESTIGERKGSLSCYQVLLVLIVRTAAGMPSFLETWSFSSGPVRPPRGMVIISYIRVASEGDP